MNLHDPKLGLHTEIKVLEQKLGDANLKLSAFIVSGTPFANLLNTLCEAKHLEDRNVLFMDDAGAVYLRKLFERMTA